MADVEVLEFEVVARYQLIDEANAGYHLEEEAGATFSIQADSDVHSVVAEATEFLLEEI